MQPPESFEPFVQRLSHLHSIKSKLQDESLSSEEYSRVITHFINEVELSNSAVIAQLPESFNENTVSLYESIFAIKNLVNRVNDIPVILPQSNVSEDTRRQVMIQIESIFNNISRTWVYFLGK